MHLRLDDVSFGYEAEKPLAEGITLLAEAGTITAIVGPSGSGKSTLLDVVGQLRRPIRGAVDFGDTAGGRRALAATDCSWVMQSNPMLRGRTALHNASLGLLAVGGSISESSVAAISALADVGLEHRIHARVGELSGGEIQRVAVARSVLSPRPVVLADEPTGQLDADNTAAVVRALLNAATSGKVVIVATHDPAVAAAADLTIALRSGVVIR